MNDKVVERIREIRRNFGDRAFDEAVVECIEELDTRVKNIEKDKTSRNSTKSTK